MSKSNIESIYPLSPMQHGMLFHCLYAPESEVYFDQFTCTLHGGLDVEAFARAWQKVVDRHQVLRTSFVWERREKPLQVVQRNVKLPLTQLDWRELKKNQQQERLDEFIQADRARSFDLSKAPLMRQALIRLSDDVYQFLWSCSHLLLDGWSNPLILGDVFAYYDAYRQGKALELAAPRPYQDYIHWLQRQDVGQAERFWRPVLAGFRAPTPLGVDKTLPVKDDLIAYEMACRLHERGERVALVALLDTGIHDPSAETREVDQAEMLVAAMGQPQPELLAHLRTLEPDAQLEYVLDWAHRINALPPDWGLVEVRHLFNMFKINVFAGLNYVPKIYPGPVTLFRAEEQWSTVVHPPLLGWDKYAAGGVEMHVVPGNHFNMAYKPHVGVLAEQLTISLDKAQAEDGPRM